MKEIRTRNMLQHYMQQEFAWRKKELHGLKTLVRANEKTHNRELCLRAAVTLLYAHWEGFVKQIGTYFLEFVARQRLNHNQLSSNFLALCVASLVRNSVDSSKVEASLQVVNFFRVDGNTRSRIRWQSGINTMANLKSDVFRDIVLALGLDYSRFATKEKLLDEKLLGNRNRIAHGQYSLVDFAEYLNLHDEMLGIMQDFYNQVDNSAYTGSFKLQ